MKNEILNIPKIILKWTDWIPWDQFIIDSRSGDGVLVPNGISGVYEVKHKDSNERLTIGKASDLRMRIKQGLVKGKTAHSTGKRIRRKEKTSKLVIRWAVTGRPCAAEEELHTKYKRKFGKLPKYVKHT